MIKPISYSQAVKRNIAYAACFIICVSVCGAVLYPVNTPIKRVLFSILSLAAGVLCIIAIKQSNKALACKSCSADIYFFTEMAKNNKLPINYCPVCGVKIEV